MTLFKPLVLVIEKPADPDGRRVFDLDPDLAWPPVIQRIQASLDKNALPIELYQDYSPPEIDPRAVAREYLTQARGLPRHAWELALMSRDDKLFTGPPEKVSHLLKLREAALTMTRLWFTQALHVSVDGHPMSLRILNRPPWRN